MEMKEPRPILCRCAEFGFSARPTNDGENVLIQVWFRNLQDALDFNNLIEEGHSASIASIVNNPVDYFNCMGNELHDFPEERVNLCLRGFNACTSLLF